MRVDVYWNLHKRCWSVRHKGRVIAHADRVDLQDVRFVVNAKGQERVRKTGRKNVHAFARGTLRGIDGSTTDFAMGMAMSDFPPKAWGVGKDWRKISYNPYRDDTFMASAFDRYGVVSDCRPATSAAFVTMEGLTFSPRPRVMAKIFFPDSSSN